MIVRVGTRLQQAGKATQWTKGQSGNPSGRPKGLASQVREKVQPEIIVGWLFEIAEDPKHRDRLKAIQELADRGWGKAPAYSPVEGADPLEQDAISAEIRLLTDQLARRFDERTTGNGSKAA